MNAAPVSYRPERLAYWYFRLNGFLTTENFIIHPDLGSQQRTDADVIAVRFRHRSELRICPMVDDPAVAECGSPVNIIIAEVKTGPCALNGPWTNPAKENLQRVISAIGCVAPDHVERACRTLYQQGKWADEVVMIRLFAVGERRSELPIPHDQQLIWNDMIDFIVRRFRDHKRQKSSLGSWSDDGRALRTATARPEHALREIRSRFGLAATDYAIRGNA